MKFIKKEERNLKYGDFISLPGGSIGIVFKNHSEACVVNLEDGCIYPELIGLDLKSLSWEIRRKTPSARIIESENIEIREV